MEFNTKIEINGKIFYINEEENGSIAADLFNIVEFITKEFIINDDGGDFKRKLKQFDISPDKQFGNKWHFEINDSSRPLIEEVLEYYFLKQWGHLKFTLIGETFEINYEEQGDPIFDENSQLTNYFKITAKGIVLRKIINYFKKFKKS